jgi:hypothetical protein
MSGGVGQRLCLPVYEWSPCYALSCTAGNRPSLTGQCELAPPCSDPVPCYSPFALNSSGLTLLTLAACSGTDYADCLPTACQPGYVVSGTVCRVPPCTEGETETCQVGSVTGTRSCRYSFTDGKCWRLDPLLRLLCHPRRHIRVRFNTG